MSQILSDLSQIADEGPGNSYLLARVALQIKQRVCPDESIGSITREIEAHCVCRDSPSGRVLHGWCLRRGKA